MDGINPEQDPRTRPAPIPLPGPSLDYDRYFDDVFQSLGRERPIAQSDNLEEPSTDFDFTPELDNDDQEDTTGEDSPLEPTEADDQPNTGSAKPTDRKNQFIYPRGRIKRLLGDMSLRGALDRSFSSRVGLMPKKLSKSARAVARSQRREMEAERVAGIRESLGVDAPLPGPSNRINRVNSARSAAEKHAASQEELLATKPSWFYRAGSAVRLVEPYKDRVDAAVAKSDSIMEPPQGETPRRYQSEELDRAKASGDINAYKKELRRLAGEDGFESRREIVKRKYGRDLDQEEVDREEAIKRARRERVRRQRRHSNGSEAPEAETVDELDTTDDTTTEDQPAENSPRRSPERTAYDDLLDRFPNA